MDTICISQVDKHEIWKVFPNHENYLISTLGRIFNKKHKRLVAPEVGKNGYCKFKVFPEGEKGKCKKFLLHRAVLETFLGKCPYGLESSHLNGDRSDNRLVNLCYETRIQNNARKIMHGTALNGTSSPKAKLTEYKIIEARNEWKKGVRGHGLVILSRKYGVHPSTLRDALTGEHWKHMYQAPEIPMPKEPTP